MLKVRGHTAGVVESILQVNIYVDIPFILYSKGKVF